MKNILHKKNRESGYSLAETIVYMALFVTLSTVLISALVGMTKSYKETRINNDLLDSTQVSLERMSREIRSSTAVDTGASTLGVSPGVLVLNSTNPDGSPKTIRFARNADEVFQITDSSIGSAQDLTESRIAVTSLIFRNLATTHGAAVRIEMTVQSLRSASGRSITFSDTIGLRGSY